MALLRHGGYRVSLGTPTSGRLTISWHLPAKRGRHGNRRAELIATGHATFSNAGTEKLKITLTRRARTLLRRNSTPQADRCRHVQNGGGQPNPRNTDDHAQCLTLSVPEALRSPHCGCSRRVSQSLTPVAARAGAVPLQCSIIGAQRNERVPDRFQSAAVTWELRISGNDAGRRRWSGRWAGRWPASARGDCVGSDARTRHSRGRRGRYGRPRSWLRDRVRQPARAPTISLTPASARQPWARWLSNRG